jgi:predicted transcriptional regulator
MFIEIEIISGKILDLLDDNEKLNSYEIRKIINEPQELISQSLQWLISTGFITEDALTREYAANGMQKVSKEALMDEFVSKK